ncbi:hypothetical protein MON38_19980 [Hymenobacter sp. DH14]|uniref:Uncharacterized protein n=1 Tax=Hymenobacter cyanobacteriorum TaxID=2926463 RepID=A0A9X1VK59_9BACT|nr:hypothetical protein [Hymenobacter cyanobacteriorum]MCI1189708.1 hypothetical protein [Hymenobacter cyanobacteriorum]
MEELLQPRHPLDKQHQAQLQVLHQLPEIQRAEMARLFRLGNATYRYQQLADGEVTEEDYRHWLQGLPERFRQAMVKGGFAGAKYSLALRRHALERRDVGYSAFMQAILSPEDWAFEQQQRAAAGL